MQFKAIVNNPKFGEHRRFSAREKTAGNYVAKQIADRVCDV